MVRRLLVLIAALFMATVVMGRKVRAYLETPRPLQPRCALIACGRRYSRTAPAPQATRLGVRSSTAIGDAADVATPPTTAAEATTMTATASSVKTRITCVGTRGVQVAHTMFLTPNPGQLLREPLQRLVLPVREPLLRAPLLQVRECCMTARL